MAVKFNLVLLILSLYWTFVFMQVGPNNTRPKCAGPNEEPTDCIPCDQTCYSRYRSSGISCAAVCTPGCKCKNGYLRHDNGTCVPVYKCSPPKCNDDEVYESCGTCEASCNTLGNTCLSCIAACIDGCYCKEGTVRGPDGISCIKPSDCPKKICGVNEVFAKCPRFCPPGNCSDIWSDYDCSKALDCCEPRCVCRSGYLRNKRGICITENECIQTQGE